MRRKRGIYMKVVVDQDLCISCGLCVDTCPEVYSWNDDEKSEAIDSEVPEEFEDCAREALEGCPTDAIREV